MDVMDSPTRSNLDLTVTPKAKKLYWPKFTEEISPQFCGFPERQEEFGWDDSPEPLKFESKLITGNSKKRLDCLDSPVSTNPMKNGRRSTRAKRRTSPSADKDLALIQQLSRRILSNTSTSEPALSTGQPSESNCKAILPPSNCSPQSTNKRPSFEIFSTVGNSSSGSSSCDLLPLKNSNVQPTDHNTSQLDSVLQRFYKEEEADEWLSQVDIAVEPRKTPGKSKFIKCRSENQLESPGRTNGFRRTSSFQPESSNKKEEKQVENSVEIVVEQQPLKKQKSFHVEAPRTQTQCTLAEIEKKRLEAKYRREFKEIERKRLEAQKRLNERRARVGADNVKLAK